MSFQESHSGVFAFVPMHSYKACERERLNHFSKNFEVILHDIAFYFG
jgi:hypothetical protein